MRLPNRQQSADVASLVARCVQLPNQSIGPLASRAAHTIHNNSLQFLSVSPLATRHLAYRLFADPVVARIRVCSMKWTVHRKTNTNSIEFLSGEYSRIYVCIYGTSCRVCGMWHCCSQQCVRHCGATTYRQLNKFSQTKTRMKIKMLWNEQANKYNGRSKAQWRVEDAKRKGQIYYWLCKFCAHRNAVWSLTSFVALWQLHQEVKWLLTTSMWTVNIHKYICYIHILI